MSLRNLQVQRLDSLNIDTTCNAISYTSHPKQTVFYNSSNTSNCGRRGRGGGTASGSGGTSGSGGPHGSATSCCASADVLLQQTLLNSISISGEESYPPLRAPSSCCTQTSRTLLEIACGEINSYVKYSTSAVGGGTQSSSTGKRNALIMTQHPHSCESLANGMPVGERVYEVFRPAGAQPPATSREPTRCRDSDYNTHHPHHQHHRHRRALSNVEIKTPAAAQQQQSEAAGDGRDRPHCGDHVHCTCGHCAAPAPAPSPQSPPLLPAASSGELFTKSFTLAGVHCRRPASATEESATTINTFSSTGEAGPVNLTDANLPAIIDNLYSGSWELVLRGLQDLLKVAPRLNAVTHERELVAIHRKLIVCGRSPRINVLRTTCQVGGELFRIIKWTRRPEFDEMVQMLLLRTADTNRMMQADANAALDKMVLAMPAGPSVRALCAQGSHTRNPLVRCTVGRLLTAVCRQYGSDSLIGATANEFTRKRLMDTLAKLMLDKSQDCRRMGEQLCRQLSSHRFFVEYFYKDQDVRTKQLLMQAVRQMYYKLSGGETAN